MSSKFLHIYEQKIINQFHDLASLRQDTDFVVAGKYTDERGLLSKLDENGSTIWSKAYFIKGYRFIFDCVEECNNGDYMLYGPLDEKEGSAVRNFVVRVNSNGQVRWARTYHREETVIARWMVKSYDETYYLLSLCRSKKAEPSEKNIEVIKINGNGQLLEAKEIGNEYIENAVRAIPYENGLVIYGSTNEGQGWDGFMLALDSSLNQTWGKLIGSKVFDHIESICYLGNDRFAVAAVRNNAHHTYFYTFTPTATSFNFCQYNLVSNRDSGYKVLIHVMDYFYLLGNKNGGDFSFVTKLDTNYNLIWHRRLKIDSEYQFRDIIYQDHLPEELRLAGWINLKNDGPDALLMKTGLEWESCEMEESPKPRKRRSKVGSKKWNPPIIPIEIIVKKLKLSVRNLSPNKVIICPQTINPGGGGEEVPDLVLGQNTLVQSSYIYLQAAGSDFSDESVRGFHLRWDLLRRIGEKHLPKGDLSGTSGPYPSTINFNRDDDYVRIYRTPFVRSYKSTVNFSLPPTSVIETGPERFWIYEGIVPNSTFPNKTSTIKLRFDDVNQYDNLRNTYNPSTQSRDIIREYGGMIEAWTDKKLFFYVRFNTFQGSTSYPSGIGEFRVETISLPDTVDQSTREMSSRKHFTNLRADVDFPEVICENIESIRFDYGRGIAPDYIDFITYEDYLRGTAEDPANWKWLGNFSLLEDTTKVFEQLEDTSKYNIHKKWRKYNEPTSSGEFRVNVNNYKVKWNHATEGLRKAVIDYLTLSKTDFSATAILPNQDDVSNTSEMEISYLDMLNMVSIDFHVARMLGLGHIDVHPDQDENLEYLFLMEYVTEAQLEAEIPSEVQHIYMTPPLRQKDHKTPPSPELKPVSYGLSLDNKTGNPTDLTDADGYTPHADIRFVNLNRKKFRYEMAMESFFQTNQLFCLCCETIPVSFGVEYGAGNIGSGNFIRPELPHDVNYFDPAGLPEVIPIVEQGKNPIFIHQEKEEGRHHYAMYSINWFSRTSPISNEVATDVTDFPKRSTLIPPLNLAVQLIQEESPLIFTTNAEQTMLDSISGADKTLMRVTFDWNYIHNKAYQFADKVQLFFRKDLALTVKGKIQSGSGSIIENSADHLVTVKTTSYQITSTNPAQTIQPNITAAEKARFIGSRLMVGNNGFYIEDIVTTASGDDPTFVLRQIRNTHLQDPDGNNIFCMTETWDSPSEGDMFFVVENLNDPASWDQILSKEVDIVNFSPTHTESITHDDGQTDVLQIGGLTDTATISHVYDTDPSVPSNTPTGVYTIVLDTKQLPPISDPDVQFYRGVIRIPIYGATEMKELKIWDIDTSLSTLRLTVYDAVFAVDPIIPASPSSQSSIFVNVHPSYRAYFEVDGSFNENNILPGLHEGTRQTLVAARSRDSVLACESSICPSVVLLAQELRDPEPPGLPLGPLFATRPNFYNKASYTFDMEVSQPYSLIIYRANDRRVLDQLYLPETVKQVESDLTSLNALDERYNTNRWSDLVNMATDGDDLFPQYTQDGFRFPIPDNSEYVIPHPDPSIQVKPFLNNTNPADSSTISPGSSTIVSGTTSTMKEIVKQAIDSAFTPMTEQPPVFEQLAKDSFQTYSRPPKVKDQNGQRLLPTDTDYDPWPMMIRYEKDSSEAILLDGDSGYGSSSNKKYVRFTDFTLDGNSSNQYFYFGVELSNTLAVSDRSGVSGPISLLPASPPEEPVISKLSIQLKDVFNGIEPAVKVSINPYLISDGIKLIKLYRALTAQDSLSIRTMTEVSSFDAIDLIEDDFSYLGFVPYGESIYYRVVVFREINNEQGEAELIPSKPSKRSRATIADNVNPIAPIIAYASSPLTTVSPMEYQDVIFNWEPSTYNATYYLYKMDDRGTWVKIHQLSSNDDLIELPLEDTDWGSSALEKQDDDGNTLYHRFKIKVINSSGLTSLKEEVLVI